MEKVKLYANLERTIAHSERVATVLQEAAFKILFEAEARLQAHRKTGRLKLHRTVGLVDNFVNLEAAVEGADPLAAELGWHTENGTFVRGLHILKDAIL